MNRLSIIFLFIWALHVFGQNSVNVIPYPRSIEVLNGNFRYSSKIEIHAAKNSYEAKYLKNYLEKNFSAKVGSYTTKTQPLNINLHKNKTIKLDGYELQLAGQEASIFASTEKGLFYGIQTLIQLFEQIQTGNNMPNLTIKDDPKFEYRGMHLDVSRHFFSVSEVKKYLEYLARYKYNKFHWHLTDDQGWRIEIKKYPKLTKVGAWREGSQVGSYSEMKFDQKKYGGYYTQKEVQEVVAYAKQLHIDVIPEIEMPGHAVAAIASYPELSCLKGEFKVSKKWGVEDNILCPKEETFTFLEGVIDEVAALFPYEYIHIGGDEAPKKAWKESEFCQNMIQKLGLKDEHELQSYFITKMEKYINSKGKKIIGWNEILEGGLAPNATVMSWTGIEGGIQAAKSKHKAIMTPTSTNYFDYYQGNPETEPIAIGGDLPLEKVYAYQPIPKELSKEESTYIWGTQGNLWTEYISNFSHVEHMIFPRMMALAEVAWGTSNSNLYKNFENRVQSHFTVLDRFGIQYSTAIFEVSGKTIHSENKIFYQLHSAGPNENIRYTLDGTEPTYYSTTYTKPILLDKTTTLKAASFQNNQKISATLSQNFVFSKSTGKNLELKFPASEAYNVGGSEALVDAVEGNPKNHGKSWLGFSGKDCIATIDLGNTEKISEVSFNTYHRPGSWIYAPKGAEVLLSQDGKNFDRVALTTAEDPLNKQNNTSITFPKTTARFVRIHIKNFGEIPDGNEGAGNAAWLFVDEININ